MSAPKNSPRPALANALTQAGWRDECSEWDSTHLHGGAPTVRKQIDISQQQALSKLRDSLGIVELKEDLEQLKRLAGCGTFVTYLHSLGVAGLDLAQRVPVTVERDGEDFIASFLDANISAGGCTVQKAVSNLQSLIADMFIMDENEDVSLSPAMTKQRNVLREFVCRISQRI